MEALQWFLDNCESATPDNVLNYLNTTYANASEEIVPPSKPFQTLADEVTRQPESVLPISFDAMKYKLFNASRDELEQQTMISKPGIVGNWLNCFIGSSKTEEAWKKEWRFINLKEIDRFEKDNSVFIGLQHPSDNCWLWLESMENDKFKLSKAWLY
jgi:hypothetical protein